jgi:peroxiredoxin Q/BCP
LLEAGSTAPDFTLPDQDGNPVTLSDLRGQTVVLYFYPKADTFGRERRSAVPAEVQWRGE